MSFLYATLGDLKIWKVTDFFQLMKETIECKASDRKLKQTFKFENDGDKITLAYLPS